MLVTGAGTGIGEAISRQLHAEGYRVTLLGRRREPLAALSATLGANSHAVSGDVTDRAGIASAFATARERFGDIEILVNSAGMAPTAPFHRLDFSDWQRTMDVNVNGVFHCSQIALEAMLGAGWGRIINIASVASLRGFPYVSGYCASKHAVLGLTRAVALEVQPKVSPSTRSALAMSILISYGQRLRKSSARPVGLKMRHGALHSKQSTRAPH
ncbi:MAG: hypothetical protein CM15mP74_09550 [Halieaceae bacterium]|nr:MAG: hypothetical protein CM15mP74_09550 [Halieaceae bacterium]